MNLNLWLNIIGGSAVLLSYALVLPKKSSKAWWVGLPPYAQTWFWVSIVIAITFYLLAFSVGYNRQFSWEYYLMMALFYLGASLWAPMVWLEIPMMVLLALSLTSIGALGMAMFSYDPVIFMCMFVVFLHCFLMDNVAWYLAYMQERMPLSYL